MVKIAVIGRGRRDGSAPRIMVDAGHEVHAVTLFIPGEDWKVKTAVIALTAALIIAAAPAVLAQGAQGKTPGAQHRVSHKHRPGVTGHAPLREMQAKGAKKGNPGAFGYAPGQPGGLDRETEMSRQAGGGGM
jgi:hypothetical protein